MQYPLCGCFFKPFLGTSQIPIICPDPDGAVACVAGPFPRASLEHPGGPCRGDPGRQEPQKEMWETDPLVSDVGVMGHHG